MSSRGPFSSTDNGGALMHSEFMAFATDEDSIAIIRAWAVRQGFPPATTLQGGPDIFTQMLDASSPPKMVIVDIDGNDDPERAIERLVGLCGQETRILALGSANDVGLYRRIIASGASDYLVKPLTNEALSQAVAGALRGGKGTRAEQKEAKVIVVIGTRGGIGASSIAVNTSWLMAHEFKLKVALLDLDLQFGTSSLALDLEPGRGLRDIVSSPHRVDNLMITSSMITESDLFSVLAAEESVEDLVPIDSAAITALLKEMRNNFDVIVVDLPRHHFAAQKRLMAVAQEIVLVAELSLAGIRDALRVKTALKSVDCPARVTVIASRTNAAKGGHVDAAAFEKGAQIKIDYTMPEDHKSFALAANSGKALGEVARSAPITKTLQILATKLGDQTSEKSKKSGFWSKLTSSKAKAKKETPS